MFCVFPSHATTFFHCLCAVFTRGIRPARQPAAAAPASITLQQAIARARANEPNFAAAVAAQRVAALDHSIARAALLPGVSYHNQVLYTQPNGATNGGGPVGSQAAPRFIANNAVREYASQAVVTETLGLQQVTAVSRAAAAEAVATAELEIARRGLVSTVTALFYQALAADRKVDVARRAAGEAAGFTNLTQQRETAREGAHADVVKAQLQQQQRDRDLADALLERRSPAWIWLFSSSLTHARLTRLRPTRLRLFPPGPMSTRPPCG